mgnify:CR=1 FL=1
MPAKPTAPSSKDLARRRQYLRSQRRYKFYKNAWRSLALTGCAAGLLWLATSPIWLIRGPSQLNISNNELLSDEAVQTLLPLPYPLPLLKVKPKDLEASLEAHAPIAEAAVSRRLLPPGLHVRVKERQPVAVALPDTSSPMQKIPDKSVAFRAPGLIDAQGYWMPRNSFQSLGSSAGEPALTVLGMRAGEEKDWQNIYAAIAQSPVKVTAIDWTRPSNLILQSELGAVHLGPYGKGFENQLVALDQLRSLNEKVNPEKVAFIDLHDPAHPVVEILQATSTSVDL